MLSVPFHAIQTVLPGNTRTKDFGGGRRGIEIDGNNAAEPTGFTQRFALTQGETRSIRSSVLVQSDLVSQSNGFEGIGCDMKFLVRNGLSTTPLVTYTNAPFKSGDASQLYNLQYPEWTIITEVVQVPYRVPVEFVDITWALRGSSGQTRFASANARNLYEDSFLTTIGTARWQDFDRQLIPIGTQGHTIAAEIRYMDAYEVRASENAEVLVKFDTYIDFAGFYDIAGSPSKIILMIGIKMRRRDGGYDWWAQAISNTEGSGTTSSTDSQMRDVPVSTSPSFICQSAYVQFEPVVYVLSARDPNEISVKEVSHRGITFDVSIKEPVRSGTS